MLVLSPYHFSDRLLMLLCALLANALLLGTPMIQRLLGIFALSACFRLNLQRLEHKLNRSTRSSKDRLTRGVVMLIVVMGLFGMVVTGFSDLTALNRWGWIMEVVILGLFLPQRQIFSQGRRVIHAMQEKESGALHSLIHDITLRDTSHLDHYALRRVWMEHLASCFADRLIAPALWYVLLGFSGFIASHIVTEAAHQMGYASRRHAAFGKMAAVLDVIFNKVPEWQAAWLLIGASVFVTQTKLLHVFKALSLAQPIAYPLKGRAVAAMAVVLDITLGGRYTIRGILVRNGWVGSGTAKPTLPVVQRSLWLYVVACLLHAVVILVLLYAMTIK